MRTLILSDIHLGSHFNKAGELSDFIRNEEFRRMIILGDLFDKPRIDRLRDQEWHFLEVIKNLSKHRGILWVEGNHDEALYDEIPSLLNIRAEKKFEWFQNGRKLLAIHGNQFDLYCMQKTYLAHCAGIIYTLLRRIDLLLRRDIFHSLCFENKSWKHSSSIVNEGALEYARNQDADVIFCGHTHRATSIRKDGVEYFNTGCWNDRHSQYAMVDNRGVSLRKFAGHCEVVQTVIDLTVSQPA